mmetsp:Transcript_9602/g.18116  ORF Transcript_9602/g.18116 Transcript_9602/m.18116 type:complete len:265 (+) Transcript_9602:609-1403(+)
MQIELVLSDPRGKELDVVLHDLGGFGDLFDTDDLALARAQNDPPCLLLREGEARSVNQPGLFVFSQVVTSQCDADGTQVALVNLVVLVVVHKDSGLHVEVRDELAARKDVAFLLIGHVGQTLLLLVGHLDVLADVLGPDGRLALFAVLHFLVGEVGQLEEGRVARPEGLRDELPEVDAVHGRLELILVLTDGDHCLDQAVGVAQHVGQVVLGLGGELVGLTKEVRVHQNVAGDADGMIVLGLLHLTPDSVHNSADLGLFLGGVW